MSQKLRRRLLVHLVLALGVGVLMSQALAVGWLRPLQLQTGDLLLRLKPAATPKWGVLVAIDDRSLAELRPQGRFFNWRRDLHARVTDNLKAAGTRIIVWDVLFDAPAEGDQELAESFRRAANVVLAEVGDESTRLPTEPGQPRRYAATIEQLPALREAALGIGHANADPDSDGVVRTAALVMTAADQDVPGLPLISAAKFLRRPQVFEAPIQDGKLPFAGRDIPLDQAGRMLISYLGDSFEATTPPTFPVISYVDALNNSFSPDLVRGKIAFVGLTATGFADDFWTPVSRANKMDGVEIHANAFETIIQGDRFIVPAPLEWTRGLIFGASLVPALTLLALSPVPALLAGLVAAAAYVLVAVLAIDPIYLQALLERLGRPADEGAVVRIFDLPFPLLTLGLSYLTILMYRVIFEQAQQRALKGALSQYLSPYVMHEVVRDPSALKLGGDKRDMTVLFSDIRGFTSLSETLDPEKLVNLLNVYLTRMTEVIFKHEGTVDKYMGDAIMAFWGAPKLQPDHARLACRAALEMLHELGKLNEELEREGVPRLNIGIGLNTGPMAVGNMGSARRFDYTVMGDAVNLASRLEGLNKEYGTNLIVSESTLAEGNDRSSSANGSAPSFRARFLDLVAVKGKREPTPVYELLPADGQIDPGLEQGLAAYERGLECYRAGDYAGALPHFEEARRLKGVDGPAAVYVERCHALIENPPPADWDGVFVMTHK